MTTPLLDQLRDYGEHFEAALPPREFDEASLRSISSTGRRPGGVRPMWVAAVAAAVIVAAVGLVALLTPLPGDEATPVVTTPTIPVQPGSMIPDSAAPRPIDVTSDVAIAPDGTLWATTEAGIVRWDLAAMTPTVYPTADLPTGGGGLGGIVAAPDGTIWAFTGEPQRILRFDGDSWSQADGFADLTVVNPPCIPDQDCLQPITGMAVGVDGIVWVAVGPETLVRYDGATWEVIEVTAASEVPSGAAAWGSSLTVAPGGTLWAAGWEEVLAFDGAAWTRYPAAEGLPERGILSMAVAPDGTVWAGAVADEFTGRAGGLARQEGSSWAPVTANDGLFSKDVRSLAIGEDGTLWAVHGAASDGTPLPGTRRAGGALSRFENDTWSSVFLDEVGAGFGMESVVDGSGSLWVASRWGIIGYDGDQAIGLRVPESMVPVGPDETPVVEPEVPRSRDLPDTRPIDRIADVDFAPDGSLWAATQGGVIRWDLSTSSATVFTEDDGLPSDQVRAVAAMPDGTVWITAGPEVVLVRYDGAAWETFEKPGGIASGRIGTIEAESDGTLWVSDVGDATLLEFDGTAWTEHPVPGLVSAMSLAVAPDGTVWATGLNGLVAFDGTDWTTFDGTDGFPAGGLPTSMAVAPDGTVWVGTDAAYVWPDGPLETPARGIARYNGAGWEVFTDADGLASNEVTGVTVDRAGTVWVTHGVSPGSPEPMLSWFDGTSWSHLVLTDLPDIGGVIQADVAGTLWMSSSAGIVRFDGETATLLQVPTGPDFALPPDSSVIETPSSILTTRAARPVPPVATCPAGSRPDQPGLVDQDRPPKTYSSSAIDEQSGVMVALADTARDGSRTWTFDLCTNTWQLMHPDREPPSGHPSMIYDRDSDRTVAVGWDTVWSYDVETDTWTEHGRPPEQGLHWLTYHDPSGLVVVHSLWGCRESVTGDCYMSSAGDLDLWAYDLETDTWTAIAQTSPLEVGESSSPILVYDPSIDRFVLYLGDNCEGGGPYDGCGGEQTWIFDQHTGTWAREDTVTPEVSLGFGAVGGEATFDASTRRMVVFNDGVLIAHDARTQEWELLYQAVPDRGPFNRSYQAIAFDPVNQRLVMTGGEARMLSEDPFWEDRNDVWAFDTGTGEWIVLLEQGE